MDDSTSAIDITAVNSDGTLIPVETLPEEYQQLIHEAKKRAVAAGALSPSYLIPQLDGEDDEVKSCNIQLCLLDELKTKHDMIIYQPDEDEINSDLDDSDEDDDEAEGGEDLEHIILCLYDKVC
jgi:transcription initiation factor TFIIA large subunit